MSFLVILIAGQLIWPSTAAPGRSAPPVDVVAVRQQVLAACAVDGSSFVLDLRGSIVVARVASGISAAKLDCLARSTRARVPDVQGFATYTDSGIAATSDPCSRTANAAVAMMSPDDTRCRPERGRLR